MAIYHLEAKIISRGTDRTAVAAAAYQSGEKLYNDYDGITHDYTRKGGVLHSEIMLSPNAPAAWADRQTRWNAVELAEKQKDSRLARQFVTALPTELPQEEWVRLLQEFVQNQCVASGMCADFAIHNPDGHNPHAHIMLTMRPLDAQGNWTAKTQKEYQCRRGEEERGFTASESLQTKAEGWEKQYKYRDPKDVKKGTTGWHTPSAAALHPEWVRTSKQPKPTKHGRETPLCAQWNSQPQLVAWRTEWAALTNRYLEQAGVDARIDHRSHAARGLTEQPTIHEGYTAHKIELAGFTADRCEINRQIRADNKLLRELKAQLAKLADAVLNTIPALAKAMETVRQSVLEFSYRLRCTKDTKARVGQALQVLRPDYRKYETLVAQLKYLTVQKKALQAEKKSTPMLQIFKHRELAKQLATVSEEIEELRSEKNRLLATLNQTDDAGMTAIKRRIADLETVLHKLEQTESSYTAALDNALAEYHKLAEQGNVFDAYELLQARKALRPELMEQAKAALKKQYGRNYDALQFTQAERNTYDLTGGHDEFLTTQQKAFEQAAERNRLYQEQHPQERNRDFEMSL